jgi:hypothetical protein
MNDRNSLCWRESIGEMALYVNRKVSTIYPVIGLGYGEKACEGCQAQAGYLYEDGIYWVLCLFWPNLDRNLNRGRATLSY